MPTNNEKEEIVNAIIEEATITSEEPRLLSAWVTVDYGGTSQAFGGYALYLPKSFLHHKLESVAGHFLFRVMEVAGVTDWAKLPGRSVRVRRTGNRIRAIGHIIKDDWFDPSADFAPFTGKQ